MYRLFYALPKDDSSASLSDANGEPLLLPLASLLAHCYTLPRLAEFMTLLAPKGYKPPSTTSTSASTSVMHKLLVLTALASLPHPAWLEAYVPDVLGVASLLLKHPNPLVPVFTLHAITRLLAVLPKRSTVPSTTLTHETLKLITLASRHSDEAVTRVAVKLMHVLLQRQDKFLMEDDDTCMSGLEIVSAACWCVVIMWL